MTTKAIPKETQLPAALCCGGARTKRPGGVITTAHSEACAEVGDLAIGTVRPPSAPFHTGELSSPGLDRALSTEELARAHEYLERKIAAARPARALPSVHRVKSWPEQFRAALTGRKRFEIRRDDRNYQTGDTIELLEYTPNLDQLELVPGGGQPGSFTGRAVMFVIGYISRGGPVPPGWCAFDLISTDDLNRVEGVRR